MGLTYCMKIRYVHVFLHHAKPHQNQRLTTMFFTIIFVTMLAEKKKISVGELLSSCR